MTIAAATQSSSLFGILPLLAVFVAGAILLRWNRRSGNLIRPQLARLEHELSSIGEQVLLASTDDVPGFQTTRTLGYVEALSPTEAASDWEYRLAEKDALLKLAQKARDMGANAVIGIRKANAHYDQAGSQWRVSRVTYCGTAVICAKSS